MRQLTCSGPGTLEWREVPAPRLEGDLEALVRPIAVARCDIDPFLCAGFFPQRGPFAVGHECVGEVVELGAAVEGLAVGQRVAVSFQISCGRCASCAAGHSAICDRMPVLSDYGMQPLSGVEYGGMLSDLIRVPFARPMLEPVGELDPVGLASVSDTVLDGYRAVAPHLRAQPGAEVLIAAHGLLSIPLYAAQAALALGAARVDFASDNTELLERAAALGARALQTDFGRPEQRYPIVVDAGITPAGLAYSIRATRPEGTCQSVSSVPATQIELPLVKMYTLGLRFFIGRCHATRLLPEVMSLIREGRLDPARITTQVASWEDAPRAWLEPGIKLVVQR